MIERRFFWRGGGEEIERLIEKSKYDRLMRKRRQQIRKYRKYNSERLAVPFISISYQLINGFHQMNAMNHKITINMQDWFLYYL